MQDNPQKIERENSQLPEFVRRFLDNKGPVTPEVFGALSQAIAKATPEEKLQIRDRLLNNREKKEGDSTEAIQEEARANGTETDAFGQGNQAEKVRPWQPMLVKRRGAVNLGPMGGGAAAATMDSKPVVTILEPKKDSVLAESLTRETETKVEAVETKLEDDGESQESPKLAPGIYSYAEFDWMGHPVPNVARRYDGEPEKFLRKSSYYLDRLKGGQHSEANRIAEATKANGGIWADKVHLEAAATQMATHEKLRGEFGAEEKPDQSPKMIIGSLENTPTEENQGTNFDRSVVEADKEERSEEVAEGIEEIGELEQTPPTSSDADSPLNEPLADTSMSVDSVEHVSGSGGATDGVVMETTDDPDILAADGESSHNLQERLHQIEGNRQAESEETFQNGEQSQGGDNITVDSVEEVVGEQPEAANISQQAVEPQVQAANQEIVASNDNQHEVAEAAAAGELVQAGEGEQGSPVEVAQTGGAPGGTAEVALPVVAETGTLDEGVNGTEVTQKSWLARLKRFLGSHPDESKMKSIPKNPDANHIASVAREKKEEKKVA